MADDEQHDEWCSGCMALTIQEQNRKIKELERQIAALRRGEDRWQS